MEEKFLSEGFIYWSILSIGIIIGFFGVKQLLKTRSLLENGVHTMGVVQGFRASEGESGEVYAPIIHYKTKGNIKRIFNSTVSSDPPRHKIGDRIHIIYDPTDAKNVKVIGYWGLYRFPIILFCIASPLLIIGGGYLLYLKF